jgi:hypothetical protein
MLLVDRPGRWAAQMGRLGYWAAVFGPLLSVECARLSVGRMREMGLLAKIEEDEILFFIFFQKQFLYVFDEYLMNLN